VLLHNCVATQLGATMELPADIIGVIVAIDPVTFLGVSKTARGAAIAAINAAITVICAHTVRYGELMYSIRPVHGCFKYDVTVFGSRGSYRTGLCDFNVSPHTKCATCATQRHSAACWLSSKLHPVVIHYREVIEIIIVAARGHRELPADFGG